MLRRVIAIAGLSGSAFLLSVAYSPSADAAACDAPTHTWNGTHPTTGHEWNDPANWVGGLIPGPGASVCIPDNPSLRTPTINTPVQVAEIDASNAALNVQSTLSVSEDSTIHTLDLTNGTIAGPGTVLVTGGGASTSSVAVASSGHLRISAGATFVATQTVYVSGDGLLEIDGNFQMAATAGYWLTHNGTPGRVVVNAGGVLQKTGTATQQAVDVPLTNLGSVRSSDGEFRLNDGTDALIVSTGNYQGIDDGVVSFGGGTHRISGSTLTQVSVVGGVVEAVGAVSWTGGEFTGGNVSGAGTVTISDLSWGGGTFAGPGDVVIPDGAAVTTTTSAAFVGTALHVDGTLGLGGNFYVQSGAVVAVAGELELDAVAGYAVTYTGAPGLIRVLESGVLRKTGSATSQTIDVPVESEGVVESTSEALRLTQSSATPIGGTLAGDADNPLEIVGDWVLADGAIVDGAMFNGQIGIETGGVAHWQSGTLSGAHVLGPGLLRVEGTARMVSAHIKENGHILVAPGATVTVPENAYVSESGKLTVAGTVEMAGVAGYALTYTGTPGSVRIEAGGVLRKSGSAFSQAIDVPVTNAGTVGSTSGELRLTGGGGQTPSTGSFVGSGSGSITLAHGTYRIGGSTLTEVTVQSGNVEITGSVPWTGGSFTGGTISGPGTITIADLTLNGGTFAGPGRIVLPSGKSATIDFSGLDMDGGELSVEGTLAMDGSLLLDSPAEMVVTGLFDLTSETGHALGYSTRPGTIRVESGGEVRKSGTAASQMIEAAFETSGLIRSTNGELLVRPAGDQPLSGTFAGEGGTVQLGTWTNMTAVGPGTALRGTVDLNARISGVVTGEDLTLTGYIGGKGTLRLEGEGTWLTGELRDTATVVVRDSADYELGSYLHVYDGASLVVRGAATIAGQLSVNDAASFDVRGTVTMPDDSYVAGDGVLALTGTLTKVGAGEANVFVPLDNDGLVLVDAGTLYVSEPWGANTVEGTLLGGVWEVKGELSIPTVYVNAATLILDGPDAEIGYYGGNLNSLLRNAANGVIELRNGAGFHTSDSLTNRGVMRLSSTSTVTMDGTFTQAGTGELEIGIADGTRGNLSVNDAATLGGALRIAPDAGYDPELDHSLAFISADSVSGTFARVQGTELGGGKRFSVVYWGTEAGLVVEAVAPDGSGSGAAPDTGGSGGWGGSGGSDVPGVPGAVTGSGDSASLAAPTVASGPTEVVLHKVGSARVAGLVRDAESRKLVRGKVRIWVQTKAGGPWQLVRAKVIDGRFNVRLASAPYRVKVVYLGNARHEKSRVVARVSDSR